MKNWSLPHAAYRVRRSGGFDDRNGILSVTVVLSVSLNWGIFSDPLIVISVFVVFLLARFLKFSNC